MTREEASFILANIDRRVCDDELNEALDMAIKALEQEPCDVFDKYGNYKYPSDVELTEPNTATSMLCEDAISRQAALGCCRNEWEEEVEERLKSLPPVTPQPKTGKWIEERNDYGEVTGWHCDKCYEDSGFTTTCKWDFCPNCGAKMQEVKSDT